MSVERTTTANRLIVVSSMKSGSTHVASVLRNYLQAERTNRDVMIWWAAEQNLTSDVLVQLSDRSFVLQMHLRPYPSNLLVLATWQIATIVQWRNLGDALVSLDDHIHREGPFNPICYVHDVERFIGLPADRRISYLIRSALPWYLAFYLSWRRERRIFHTYEAMVADEPRFFAELLRELGRECDPMRLVEAMSDRSSSRFNVGVCGRSVERLSEANRRHLEHELLEHPESDQLEVLLWELPWSVSALQPRCPWDGSIVNVPGEDALWFVSRGRRAWIEHPSWISSHPLIPRRQLRDDELPAFGLLPNATPLL